MDERMEKLISRAKQFGDVAPVSDNDAALRRWALSTEPIHDASDGLSRYLSQVWWERPDLQEAYPGVFLDPLQRREFREWVRAFGAESAVENEFLPSEEATPFEATATADLRRGVVSVGFHRAVLGVASAGRRLTRLVEASGEEVFRRAWNHTTAPLTVEFTDADDGGRCVPPLDTLLLCVNGEDTERLYRALGTHATGGRYVIGQWAWELDQLSEDQAQGFSCVNEIWVNSSFVAAALRSVAPEGVEVHTIPFGVDVSNTCAPILDREPLGLPAAEKLIGFAFDYASSVERKNPAGLIEAYCRAVPVPDPTVSALVLKSVNARLFPEEASTLRSLARERRDIVFVDRTYSVDEQHSFVRSLAGYVSLHRSEGYGISLLEAMTLGVAVAATAYSGNLDFMTNQNSWLIPYRLVHPSATGQYKSSSLWADPDTETAAQVIGYMLADTDEVHARRRRALRDAADINDPIRAATWIRNRLERIRHQRDGQSRPSANCP